MRKCKVKWATLVFRCLEISLKTRTFVRRLVTVGLEDVLKKKVGLRIGPPSPNLLNSGIITTELFSLMPITQTFLIRFGKLRQQI